MPPDSELWADEMRAAADLDKPVNDELDTIREMEMNIFRVQMYFRAFELEGIINGRN